WGATKEELKSAMKEKHTTPVPEHTSDTHLAFDGGVAAGYPVLGWAFNVAENKMWRGKITFAQEGDLDALFRQGKKMLTDTYGTRQNESFKPGEPTADWKLQNPATKDVITIHLFTEGKSKPKRLCLEYINESLKAKYTQPGAQPDPTDKGL